MWGRLGEKEQKKLEPNELDFITSFYWPTNFEKLKVEIIENVLISLKTTKNGLSFIQSWRLRKETLIILNIAKRLCNLLKKRDPLKENIKLSRIELIFCFFKGIMYD